MDSGPDLSKKRKLSQDAAAVEGQGTSSGDVSYQAQPSLKFEHGDIWYDDGNVILVAGAVGFKVYRGVLYRLSEVFREIFDQRESTREQHTFDGCPAIVLLDTAQDLLCLLSTLYDDASRYFSEQHRLRLNEVSSMIRLGTKYKLQHVRNEAIRRLNQCFPVTLEDFKVHYTMNALYHSPDPDFTDIFPHSSVSISAEGCIHVIHLAWSLDLHTILPGAFYVCAQLSEAKKFHGYYDREQSKRWKLSAKDQERCSNGTKQLRQALTRSFEALLDGPSEDCTSRKTCTTHMKQNLRSFWKTRVHHTNALLDADRVDSEVSKPLCESCTAHLKSSYEVQRCITWKELRGYFDLPEPDVPVEAHQSQNSGS
ncbi:hypothetical protein EIP91_009749 [Steccherinum ochraceum]|uniref:BTB domain-containing protein n=1 Tax=Steccherinum ochraceum TaxID=92696 RepID=A0A4R0R1A2_9APHY|nr:hypothetical protein EIP91_009749 [Steccherinum ochraceum]